MFNLQRHISVVVFPIVGICLGFLLLEGVFRLTAPLLEKKAKTDRPKFYYSPQKSETFQGPWHSPKRKKGNYRIAVVGDSFTFGPDMQYDDVFPARLERMFNLNSNAPKVEVLNFGVPGYSTNHEVEEVRRALAGRADLIILEITLNDAQLKPIRPTQITRDGGFGEITLDDGIYKWSKLAAFVASRIHNQKSHSRYVDYYHELFERKSHWHLFASSVQQIKKLVKKRKHTQLVAVVFPLFGLPLDEQYPFHDVHKKIESLLDQHSIPFLDLFSAYEGISIERLQLIPGQDLHPNEIGHRIAAESIYRWLVDMKFTPKEVVATEVYKERKSPLFSRQEKIALPHLSSTQG